MKNIIRNVGTFWSQTVTYGTGYGLQIVKLAPFKAQLLNAQLTYLIPIIGIQPENLLVFFLQK